MTHSGTWTPSCGGHGTGLNLLEGGQRGHMSVNIKGTVHYESENFYRNPSHQLNLLYFYSIKKLFVQINGLQFLYTHVFKNI